MEDDDQTQKQLQDSFVWDETSQLYYHSSSGFYHDPNAGWYYSTTDGFYYKFEDGNYILLDTSKDCQSESTINGQSKYDLDESRVQARSRLECDEDKQENECQADQTGCIGSSGEKFPENPPPTSEWLEDTLIELYLSGYATAASDSERLLPYEHDDDMNGSKLSVDANAELYVPQDGELSSNHQDTTTSSATVFCEETSLEEESWRAQYGQVVHQEDELRPECPIVDIWDWSMDQEIQQDGNYPVARLLGTLVKPSSSLHPSISSHSRRLRTAPICRVHLDLVQVRSGQVYKLRSPNAGYLATLSSYDASNPTKEWGYPELTNEGAKEKNESKTTLHVSSEQSKSSSLDRPSSSKKLTICNQVKTGLSHVKNVSFPSINHIHTEIELLKEEHFTKNLIWSLSEDEAISPSLHGIESTEGAAAEALEMSLGAGSYAQKLLKNMGWKEGEGLGKTQQGLREPLQGTGNKGTAGLGWPSGWRV